LTSSASSVSKILVYQRSSAQISDKKLVFLLVAARMRCACPVQKRTASVLSVWHNFTFLANQDKTQEQVARRENVYIRRN
jgi:hypothetical protein